MRERLILLPGWGLGASPLQPLAVALQDLGSFARVDLQPLPELPGGEPSAWLDALDATLPRDAWLAGWSLGGMLAAGLAARRGERCPGLITLASNACFVARDDWPDAMARETFEAFLAGCETNPQATLKRFTLLCAQGSEDPRALARLLAGAASGLSPVQLRHGLEVLARLDLRTALKAYRGPQLHLFGARDALVPVTAASAVRAFLPQAHIGLIERACHAFALDTPHEVAAAILAFLHEYPDD